MMIREHQLQTALLILIGLITVLSGFSILRGGAIMWSIGSEDRMEDVQPLAAEKNAPAVDEVIKPGTEQEPPAETPAEEQQALGGLALMMPADSRFYCRIDDVHGFITEARATDIVRLWSLIKPALSQQALDKGLSAWTGFLERYNFPVDSLFRGLAPQAGTLEIIISDFTLFRGRYTLKMAAACTIKGDVAVFYSQLKTNAGDQLPIRMFSGIEVFEKKTAHGTLSLFIDKSRLYITAGPDMADGLISQLQKETIPADTSFASDAGLRAVWRRLVSEEKGLRAYVSPRMLAEFGLTGIKEPAAARIICRNGTIDEYVLLPWNSSQYCSPGAVSFTSAPMAQQLAGLHCSPAQGGIVQLAALSLKLLGSSHVPSISRNDQGAFWDYLYIVSDFADGYMSGNLLWENNAMIPSWYFTLHIKDRSRFDAWLKRVSSSSETTSIKRKDGRKITIISLKRQLINFGSFCYFMDGDYLFCSYNSLLLKEVPAGVVKPEIGDTVGGLISFDIAELMSFIETKGLRGLIRLPDIDINAISDLREVGKTWGTIQGWFRHSGGGTEAAFTSRIGVTGIIPAILGIEHLCALMEE